MNCNDYTPNQNQTCTNCGQTEQTHYPHIQPKNCQKCDNPISLARLEILPQTPHCINCANKNPEPPRHNPHEICFKPSISCSNGFAPND